MQDNIEGLRESKVVALADKPHYSEGLTKFLFYLHLVSTFTYCTIIVIIHPYVVSRTLTFLLVVVYGFMLLWVLLIHSILFCSGMMAVSVWALRIGAKLVISSWPLVGAIVYYREHYLFLKELKYWMIYMSVFSVIYIAYEMLTFCCYDKVYAGWVYKVERSELKDIKEVVVQKRKEFFINNPHNT